MNTKEPEIQNLHSDEAIGKMKAIVSHNPICMFTTLLDQFPLRTRPMSALKICDQGNFWFISADDSSKNVEIRMDERVQLFFAGTPGAEYLSVYGKATISTDKEKINELWNSTMKAWFTKGKDDPGISIIKIKPENSFYWDNKAGKMISNLKIMVASVTGIPANISVSGKLVV